MICARKTCSRDGRAGALVFFVAALAGLLAGASACSSGGKAPLADGGLLTCQGIRLCVTAGSDVDTCAARGTPEGQAAFQTLRDCLAMCPELLRACVCRESCQPDGYCLRQVDACLGASSSTVDAVCGQYCGG